MRSAVEQLILAMIRDGFECRSVGDARNGTLYLDLTFERNAVCRLEDDCIATRLELERFLAARGGAA